jgi:hypothetical protein
MKIRRSYIVIAWIIIISIAGLGAIAPGARPDRAFKNLTVLPKNTSAGELSRIMIDEFEDGLGVSCSFCHTENKETHRLDYASDQKPEKEIARAMMRMTLNVNKKYFNLKHPVIGQPSLPVSCGTCHHGVPVPGQQVEE